MKLNLTPRDRDSLSKLGNPELRLRATILSEVIQDGIKESAGVVSIQELIRQRDVIVGVLKDRQNPAKKIHSKPDDIVISLKPLYTFTRRA